MLLILINFTNIDVECGFVSLLIATFYQFVMPIMYTERYFLYLAHFIDMICSEIFNQFSSNHNWPLISFLWIGKYYAIQSLDHSIYLRVQFERTREFILALKYSQNSQCIFGTDNFLIKSNWFPRTQLLDIQKWIFQEEKKLRSLFKWWSELVFFSLIETEMRNGLLIQFKVELISINMVI